MGSQARRLRKQAGVSGERYLAEQRRARREVARLERAGKRVDDGLITEEEAARRLGVELAYGDHALPKDGYTFAVDGRDVTVAPAGNVYDADAVELKIDGKSVPHVVDDAELSAPRALRRNSRANVLALATLLGMSALGGTPKGDR